VKLTPVAGYERRRWWGPLVVHLLMHRQLDVEWQDWQIVWIARHGNRYSPPRDRYHVRGVRPIPVIEAIQPSPSGRREAELGILGRHIDL